MNFAFVLSSAALGVGLAMDAFSVSMANGLCEPDMPRPRMALIAGIFAVFQALMPLTGWICVHTIAQRFRAFEELIPWIALFLLLFIGGKMLLDSRQEAEEACAITRPGFGALMVQGIATSIDALSAGFTLASYNASMALAAALIIAALTFVICLVGIALGKRFGLRLAGKAQIFGGVILILIGLKIFIDGVF